MHFKGKVANPALDPKTAGEQGGKKVAAPSKVIRELLENGVHFGHQTNKWNPKMKKYIFGAKSGIYIIDLQKTEELLKTAVDFVSKVASDGGTVLFVGTKKQAKQIIKDEAKRCEMFYVDERWLGGCMTNFNTIKKSIDKLDQLQELKGSEKYDAFAKKEKAKMDREENKLLKNLGGIREMKVLPQALVVIDAEEEDIAIKEAIKLKIPVVALLDTNCDPDIIDYPIPGNDDAIRSIRYIVSTLADAVAKGHRAYMGGGKDVAPKTDHKKAAPAEEAKPEVKAEEKKEEAPKAKAEEKKEEAKKDIEEKGDISI